MIAEIRKRFYKREKMFYRPDGKAVCADVIPFYENGEFKLFYLKDFRDTEHCGEGCDWNLLTTSDLVHYVDHGTVLKRGTFDEQDLYVYTGCCNRFGDDYYIYYTGHNPHKQKIGEPAQKILRAKSRDLLHWEKDPSFSLRAPAWLDMHDFRDPFIFYDDEHGRFVMLLAGRLKNDDPENCRGVTLAAYSENFFDWEVSDKPFFAPSAYYTHECPDLFRIGDWWYLLFSEFTDRFVTTYRMSKSLSGPWLTPEVNTFDGHAFYAAKSVSDGKRRILFGWNPIKDGERDLSPWQWGGSIVAHEILQNADGTLRVRCPEEVLANYGASCVPEKTFSMGSVVQSGNGFTVGNEYGRTILMFGKQPCRCKIEADFILGGETGDLGLLLGADFSKNQFYTLRLEPSFRRMSLDRWPRKDIFCHTTTDTERNVRLSAGVRHRLIVLIEGSVLEVYLDDSAAMGARMFDYRGEWGVYAMSAVVRFENITVSEAKDEE